jgi:hypothetical protein
LQPELKSKQEMPPPKDHPRELGRHFSYLNGLARTLSEPGGSHSSSMKPRNRSARFSRASSTQFLDTDGHSSDSYESSLSTHDGNLAQGSGDTRSRILFAPLPKDRSPLGDSDGPPASQTQLPSAHSDRATIKCKTSSRWWLPNRYVSKTKRHELKISPPVPLRPDEVRPRVYSESFHIPVPKPTQSAINTEWTGGISTPATVAPRPLARAFTAPLPEKRLLRDLDADKADPSFSRIDLDGWNKVLPEPWVQEQFSDDSSRASRSVYTQDNGEEEAKRQVVRQPTPLGSLAGEATPFDPHAQSHTDVGTPLGCTDTSDQKTPETRVAEQQRGPFEKSRLSSTSISSSIDGWLDAVRPSSALYKASAAFKGPDNADSMQRSERVIPLSSKNARKIFVARTPLKPVLEQSISPKSRRRDSEEVGTAYDEPSLVPEPLAICKAKVAPQVAEPHTESSDPPKQGADADHSASRLPQIQPPRPPSLKTSYSTKEWDANARDIEAPLQCGKKLGSATITASTPQLTDYGPATSELEAVGDKDNADTTANEKTLRDFNDSLDKILDMYYHNDCDSNDGTSSQRGPEQNIRHVQHTSQLAPSSLPSSATINDSDSSPTTTLVSSSRSATQKVLQPHLNEAPQNFPRSLPTRSSSAAHKPALVQGFLTSTTTCQFVATFPVFYDDTSHPELAHGHAEEDRARRRRRSLRAVETAVDGAEVTWI